MALSAGIAYWSKSRDCLDVTYFEVSVGWSLVWHCSQVLVSKQVLS